MEFFIHPCKFLKYSISFSFNKIKFLLSPKIHDYSLTITRDSPALEVHAKTAPRWLAQRSLSNRPRRAYLLKPPERQVCGFWEVTKPTWQNNRKSNFLTVDTLLTIIGPSDPQVRHRLRPRHVPTDRVSTQLSLHVNYLQLTRTLSAHPVTNGISFHARVGRFSPFLYLRSVAPLIPMECGHSSDFCFGFTL